MSVTEILQILGGIGVISSITFTGLQIRRNTRTLRAAAYQSVSQTFLTMWGNIYASAEIVELLLRSGDEFETMTRVEKARVRFATMVFMRTYENAYFQFKIGILKDQDWAATLGDLEGNLSRPSAPVIWDLVKNRNGAEFRAVVDQIIERQRREAALTASEAPAATAK